MNLAVAMCCVLLAAAPDQGQAPAEPEKPTDVRASFSGNTINAMVYMPQGTPRPARTAGGAESLRTLMFRAFLDANGQARVSLWDHAGQRYLAPVAERWRGDGDMFCLGGRGLNLTVAEFCMTTHVWGPVFAGVGTTVQGMVKGDIKAGNAERL